MSYNLITCVILIKRNGYSPLMKMSVDFVGNSEYPILYLNEIMGSIDRNSKQIL